MELGFARIASFVSALTLTAIATPAFSTCPVDPPDVDRVWVVVLDGLEPEDVSPLLTPRLWSLLRAGEARRYMNAETIMFPMTFSGHPAMVTGAFADRTGTISDWFLNTRDIDPATGTPRQVDIFRPSLNLSETIFDVIAAENAVSNRNLKTATVMGKARLRQLFDCTPDDDDPNSCGTSTDNPEGVPVTHVRPDFIRGANTAIDIEAIAAGHDAPAEPITPPQVTVDNLNMEIAVRLLREQDPHFVFMNLPNPDLTQHLTGAKSAASRAAILNVDLLIGRLVDEMMAWGKWKKTVLIVTADHSFLSTGDSISLAVGDTGFAVANQVTPQVTGSLIALPELFEGKCTAEGSQASFAFISHMGTASVYIFGDGYDAYAGTPLSPNQENCLKELRAAALANPGVTEALYRVPVASDPEPPGNSLASVHPEWRLDSPRTGELILVGTETTEFVIARTDILAILAGTHGGPKALPIPLLIASGGPFLDGGDDMTNVGRNVDIAATAAWLLGVRSPADSVGRPLVEICKPSP